jgi:protein-disulfide isomerase
MDLRSPQVRIGLARRVACSYNGSMNYLALRASKLAGILAALCLLGACAVWAQDWKNADVLPAVDFSGLTAAQKASALKILREHDCSCGCGMKMAQCRVQDPNCSYSKGLAASVVEALKSGKSEEDAIAAASASKWAHVQQPRLLDDPIAIPVGGAPSLGPQNASITLVEFSDFQCPYCAAAAPELAAVLKAYPTQVKLIFKQYPLETHSQAALAAAAGVAAHKQGKFWPMYDAMFAAHDDLSRDNLLALAQKNGLDLKRFQADLDSTEVKEAITRDVQDGDKAGVSGTPTLFIDGQKYNGPIDLESLKPVLEAELKHPALGAQAASAKP